MNEANEVPESFLNIGGLIGRVADYTMSQSYRPNRALAVAGAVSWVAHCMGRRFRTKSNTRTNIYMLALGWSGTGKDAPRDTIQRMARSCNMIPTVIEDFKSGEGLQDTLLAKARVISLYDEVDGLFKMVKDSRNAMGKGICDEMLKMYGRAKGFMSRRSVSKHSSRDDDKTPECVFHPTFNLFATGVTSEVYRSVSREMAMNGFFARLLVIDGGRRGAVHSPEYFEPPADIVSDSRILAGWRNDPKEWNENNPKWNDSGIVIETDSDANKIKAELQQELNAYYDESEDGAYNAIWNRAFEKIDKLALIFAGSDNPGAPVIKKCHIEVAKDFVFYSNSMQLKMFDRYGAETEYEDLQKRIVRKLEKGVICNRALLAFLKIKNEELREAMETLHDAGKIIFCNNDGGEIPEYKRGCSYALA